MDAADGKMAALDTEMIETIRRICRGTHILVTLKRDQVIREGRGEELDELVKSTRALQKSLHEEAEG